MLLSALEYQHSAQGRLEPSKSEVADSIADGDSIEWIYLHTGILDAELDHEFDRATVRTVVDSTVALDETLTQLQGR